MSTSTLVLNFVAWFVLTVLVSAVAVLIPMFLDRPARRSTPRPLRLSKVASTTAERRTAAAADRERQPA